jgi:lipoate-protein ligase A
METHQLPIALYEQDEPLLAAVRNDGRARVEISRPMITAVVLGRGSDPHRELNLDNCLADRIPLLRRRGGGCSVVIDPGNVIVSVALPVPGINHTHYYFDQLTGWLLQGLHAMGHDAVYHDGKSDLVLGNQKIGGSCVYRTKGLLHYSSTLLLAPDLEKIERYLKQPPREPEYRNGRSHSQFLSSLMSSGSSYNVARFTRELADILPSDELPECYESPMIRTATSSVPFQQD